MLAVLQYHPGRASRMKRGMRVRLEARPTRCQQALQIRFDVEDIGHAGRRIPCLKECRSVRGRGDAYRLAYAPDRQGTVFRIWITQKYATDLEHPDPRDSSSVVSPDHFHERTDETRAHHGLLAGDRVEQANRVCFAGEISLPARLDEA